MPESLPALGSSIRSSNLTRSYVASPPWRRATRTSSSLWSAPSSAELADSLGRLGTELGLDSRLFITGRVEAEVYLDWLRRAEIAVQLRASFSGEASAAVGDCLSHGLPMIVSEIGWMAELPDDAAVKVPVDITPVDLAAGVRRPPRRSASTRQAQKRGAQLRARTQFQGRRTRRSSTCSTRPRSGTADDDRQTRASSVRFSRPQQGLRPPVSDTDGTHSWTEQGSPVSDCESCAGKVAGLVR